MIEARSLSVRYGDKTALAPLDLDLARGQWLGLIGANGAGKSTLLKAIARLVEFDGVVTIDGAEVATLSRRRLAQRVAFVPQRPLLPPDMNVLEYVALGRNPHIGYFAMETAADRAIASELLDHLGLGLMANRPLSTLSGGEQQRLVLARALAQRAPVLLLDEPTSALDLGRRVEALELVDALRAEYELTIIAVLHDLTLAGQFSDRLLLLDGGEVVIEGTPDDVLQEEVLADRFGVGVSVLRTDDGQIVVVPRRSTNPSSIDSLSAELFGAHG